MGSKKDLFFGTAKGSGLRRGFLLLVACFCLVMIFLWTRLPEQPGPAQHLIEPKNQPIVRAATATAAKPVEALKVRKSEKKPRAKPKQASGDEFEEVIQEKLSAVADNGCEFKGSFPGFLGGCATDCAPFHTLQEALDNCGRQLACMGITTDSTKTRFEMRAGGEPSPSDGGEVSWTKATMKQCHNVVLPPPEPRGKEWVPPVGVELEDTGTFVDGQPTIFISVAAYRDPMCHTTISNALTWAMHPGRLRFGVVDQWAEGDEPCDYTARPCAEDPEQLLCKYKDNIAVDKVPARMARGPTFGRYRADLMYNGEYFAMQIDAHMYFVEHWDTKVIAQFEAAKNEFAVMSTYPSEAKGNVKNGISRVGTTPGICKSSFLDDGLIRHGAAGEFVPDANIVGHGDEPVLQPWWAAGLSFSRGHRIVRVPYDCCTPMTFNGEEFSMALRHWTWGYDHYTFRKTIALHPYSRPKRPPLFWENGARFPMDTDASARRLQEMFGMRPTRPGVKFPKKDIKKYGVGPKRPLSKFLKVFGIDMQKRTVRNHCRGVQSTHMHRALHKYLRQDAKGIDYTKVPDDIGNQWESGGR